MLRARAVRVRLPAVCGPCACASQPCARPDVVCVVQSCSCELTFYFCHVQVTKRSSGPIRLRSSLTEDGVDIWRAKYELPADLEVRIPRPEERVQNPPRGWLTICEVSLRSGFRFPPCEEVIEILKFCGVSISQFAPTGVARIMGLVAFFREHGSLLSLDQFRDWCDVRSDGGERVEVRSNKVSLEIEARKDRRYGNTLFGYMKNSWGLLEVWNALRDHCRHVKGKERDFSPVLGFSEPRELANRLFNIYVYVEEKRLLGCGISAGTVQVVATSQGGGRKRKAGRLLLMTLMLWW
ncbi:hypothetical protein KSP39_PZI018232 [Platanthera zijinensis]|uniref:Uncharacterized protein n=1 Tax=Platanthera zijinensis TaxID=2320716 RepID=A0AAP0B329_9ASPA